MHQIEKTEARNILNESRREIYEKLPIITGQALVNFNNHVDTLWFNYDLKSYAKSVELPSRIDLMHWLDANANSEGNVQQFKRWLARSVCSDADFYHRLNINHINESYGQKHIQCFADFGINVNLDMPEINVDDDVFLDCVVNYLLIALKSWRNFDISLDYMPADIRRLIYSLLPCEEKLCYQLTSKKAFYATTTTAMSTKTLLTRVNDYYKKRAQKPRTDEEVIKAKAKVESFVILKPALLFESFNVIDSDFIICNITAYQMALWFNNFDMISLFSRHMTAEHKKSQAAKLQQRRKLSESDLAHLPKKLISYLCYADENPFSLNFLFKRDGKEIHVTKLLEFVCRGELDKVLVAIVRQPSLLNEHGQVFDLSGRCFRNITPLQLALWYMDSSMIEMISEYMADEQKHQQYEELGNLRSIYGDHFSFNGLITQLHEFLNLYDGIKSLMFSENGDDIGRKYWCKQVGAKQLQLPAWVVHMILEADKDSVWEKKNFSGKFDRKPENLDFWFGSDCKMGKLGIDWAWDGCDAAAMGSYAFVKIDHETLQRLQEHCEKMLVEFKDRFLWHEFSQRM